MIDFPQHLDHIQRLVLAQFKLDPLGVHGIPHWRRVYRNGLLIARHVKGVDPEVVAAFALLHDAGRENEWDDPMHGVRGVQLAQRLRHEAGLVGLTNEQFIQLTAAIIDHPLGFVIPDDGLYRETIAACWDADRLDLGRVGVKPCPRLMSTPYARRPEVIERMWHEAWNGDDTIAMIEDVA